MLNNSSILFTIFLLFTPSILSNAMKKTTTLDIKMEEDLKIPRLIQTRINEKFKNKLMQTPDAPATATAPTRTTTTTEDKPTGAGPAFTRTPNNPNYELEDQKYFYRQNMVCNYNTCPLPNVCTDATTCICATGYADVPTLTQDPTMACIYVQKKQLVAFLLEFFVANGIGHFYAGRILFGVLKLLVFLGPIIIGIMMCCCGLALKPSENTSSCMGLCLMIFSCTFCCGALVWQLVDLIMFGMNKYRDGNNVPLQHW
jgi:hypothetical protein